MLVGKGLSFEGSDGLLFENVDISLDSSAKKRTAIVGRNGCGKSTLLKILKGDLQPASGSVSIARETVGFLYQDIVFADETMLVGAYLESKLEEEWMTYKVEMVLQEVGLGNEITLLELSKLSGGQRVRIALAEILLIEPTILFLDEPTNHLDTESVNWLKKFVNEFAGTVAFVSHDRDFINAVSNQIWEITPSRKIEVYGTNYDNFLIERYNRYQKALQEFEFSQRERVELEMWLRENANHPKYKFTATVAQKKKALERMDKGMPPEPVADPRIRMRNLEEPVEGTVLSLKIEKKAFDGKEILKGIELKVSSGDRILIRGPNGSGKTTLMNIIMGADKDFVGNLKIRNPNKVAYLQQFSSLDPESTVIEEFGARTAIDYTLRRNILASYLFPTELIEEKIKRLSYGQQRRLELAILLTNKPDLLLLDEPTNHLDIFVREDLENFLIEQKVAMIVISHDKYFIDKIGLEKVLELGV
ncbi:ABC-F family ATP-binding cassette domain-containing protein [Candidatus Peregrinibacteria bacterium]|nr:ABC-F family ATP-binding cassette domain-containing protein [Candidatus Peregrinibacteria bacterium]